jgi:hypothetical protein
LRGLSEGNDGDGASKKTGEGRETRGDYCGTKRHDELPDWQECTRELYAICVNGKARYSPVLTACFIHGEGKDEKPSLSG